MPPIGRLLRPTALRFPYIQGSKSFAALGASAASITDLANGLLTLDGWFRWPPRAGLRYLIYKVSGFRLQVTTAEGLHALFYYGTTTAEVVTSEKFDPGWRYVMVTIDGTGDLTPRIYVNGRECGYSVQTPGVGVTSDTGGAMMLGYANFGYPSYGWVRVSNIIRTIEMRPRDRYPDMDISTVCLWKLNEVSGTKFYDASPNAINLDSVGGPFTRRDT